MSDEEKQCGCGDELVRIAPREATILPRSIASTALVAFILVNKFVDHLPFYRQEKRFARIGIDISRQDMSNWTRSRESRAGTAGGPDELSYFRTNGQNHTHVRL